MRTKDEFNEQKQRQQLLNSAWKLFYQKGYQNTTMEDILKEAHCSKGRFYYYFHAKAELLDSMYELFDEKYEEFYQSIDKTLGSFEQLLLLNRFMFDFMSHQIGRELLTSLYISQLSGTTRHPVLGRTAFVCEDYSGDCKTRTGAGRDPDGS